LHEYVRSATGIVMDKRNIKIDKEGFVDLQTGARHQQILRQDLDYGGTLGQGNGGVVKKGIHRPTGIPVAVKVSQNIFEFKLRVTLSGRLSTCLTETRDTNFITSSTT
jgi:hypothetical protein